MRYFLIALQFLTLLKIGKVNIVSDVDLAKSMAWFSVVGILIGLILAGIYAVLIAYLPAIVVASIIVLLTAVFSGGLHLDALADTFDGIAGGKDSNDILRIMHDSNIGAIGAAAVFISLLIKFSCVYSAQAPAKAIIVSSIFSRWAFVFSAKNWPAAPDSEGLGKKFISFVSIKELLWASLAMFAAVMYVFGIKGLILITIIVLSVWIFNNFIKNKIGGLTGDTLGAAGELAECIALVIISAMAK